MRNRRKLIAFAIIMIIVVSVFSAVMMKKTKQQTLTVTDNEGVTYVAILDQNQEVYAGVTDADGNMYAARIEDGVIMTNEPLSPVSYTGTFPFNDTTRTDDISISQNNTGDVDFSGEAETKKPTEPTTTEAPGEEKEKTEPTTAEKTPEEYLSDKFIKLFNSGTFVMTFTTDDPDLTQDITLAELNGSLYMDTSMEGLACKVFFDAGSDTGYIIIPDLRVYCLLPDDLAADMSQTEFQMPEISKATSAQTYEVTIDGKDCIAEEFGYEDGSTRTFYYYNGNLVRMTVTEDNGDTTLYNIKTISSEVDSSYFTIPKGYLKVNLSWLQTQELE